MKAGKMIFSAKFCKKCLPITLCLLAFLSGALIYFDSTLIIRNILIFKVADFNQQSAVNLPGRYGVEFLRSIDNYVREANQWTAKNDYYLSSRSLLFWTSDLSDGPGRIDAPSVLQYLGQRVLLVGHLADNSSTRQRFFIPEPTSDLIMSNRLDSADENMIIANFDFYKQDPLLAKTDAFICSNCDVWMPFNKTIIFLPINRFLLGHCSTAQMQRLIDHVIAIHSNSSPKHLIAAGGTYDAEYINFFTGIKPVILPTTGLFYQREPIRYTQKRREILVGPLHLAKLNEEDATALWRVANMFGYKEKWRFNTTRELYGDNNYTMQNIADHRAIVFFADSMSSYEISEIYHKSIPIFVPTIRLSMQYGWVKKRGIRDPDYCGTPTTFPEKHHSTRHRFSPESVEPIAIGYWLQFADYYHWPHVTRFDSFDELIRLLDEMNFDEMHEKLVVSNKQREMEVLWQWHGIVDQIESGRTVPKNYQDAIKRLWNTEQLQVS